MQIQAFCWLCQLLACTNWGFLLIESYNLRDSISQCKSGLLGSHKLRVTIGYLESRIPIYKFSHATGSSKRVFLLPQHTFLATTHLAGLRALRVELHLLYRKLAASVGVVAEEHTAEGALAQQLPKPPVGGGAGR